MTNAIDLNRGLGSHGGPERGMRARGSSVTPIHSPGCGGSPLKVRNCQFLHRGTRGAVLGVSMRQPCTPGGALEAGRPTPPKERGHPGGEGGRGRMSSGAGGSRKPRDRGSEWGRGAPKPRVGLQEVAGEERPEEASGKEGGPTRGPSLTVLGGACDWASCPPPCSCPAPFPTSLPPSDLSVSWSWGPSCTFGPGRVTEAAEGLGPAPGWPAGMVGSRPRLGAGRKAPHRPPQGRDRPACCRETVSWG